MTIVKSSQTPVSELYKILIKFNAAGINIEPNALKLLGDLKIDSKKLASFIQDLSFSPHFKSLLTEDFLIKKLGKSGHLGHSNQNEKVGQSKNNKKSDAIIKSNLHNSNNPKNIIQNESNNLIQKKPKDNHSKNLKTSKSQSKSNEDIPSPSNLPNFPHVHKNITKKSVISRNSGESKKIKGHKGSKKPEQINRNKKSEFVKKIEIKKNKPITKYSENTKIKDEDLIKKIREEKRKSWETLHLRSSSVTFKPIASEYNPEISVIKDPTGKIYSSGKIKEFMELMNDRYTKLKDILKRRPESSEILDIGMINRLESSTEVKFIGMVKAKRQTASKNYIIELDDPTGKCSALIRQKTTEVFKFASYILDDQVLLIDGFLSVNPDSNNRIILINNVIFPDSPNTHRVQTPEEDLAICLISDTHFGSKEWLEKIWYRFVDYLNCRIGNDEQIQQAGKIKYLTIAGDLVDGIGVYPNQDKHLTIPDIYDQYDDAAKLLSDIPDYISIIITPGDHDAVRKAIPNPAIPKEYAKGLYDSGAKMLGCPSMVSLHGIKTQIFHGTSLIDMNMMIPGLSNEDPFGTMKEYMRARHLAPTYGRKTEIAPVDTDWMVIDPLPDILHMGHLHKNGCGSYHGTLLVNSGCFQGQTEFMDNLGIIPDFGKPTIVNLKNGLKPRVIDLAGDL
ncbi:MAG: metallophosphoesterase [Promethearchaeota archaeon]